MAVRISWASGPSGTTEYLLNSGSSNSGTFYNIATIGSSFTGSNYDVSSGLFFYDDLSGLPGTWYVVSASNGISVLESSYAISAGTSGAFVISIPQPPSIPAGTGNVDKPPVIQGGQGYPVDAIPSVPVGSAVPI